MRDILTAAAMFGRAPKGCDISDYYHAKPKLTYTPRLVNHFKLGADPEFVLSYDGERIDASRVGLKTGLFAGADQNGRLVELRPAPSKSALDVLASLLVSLRWLVMMQPKVSRYNWVCGAWQFDDGLGGHIHFGRKRPTRAQEVVALDAMAHILYMQGVFPAEEQRRRMQGDRFRQQYGLPSDFRPQVHGYEYRSLPSWLDSPWLAYLCLVLAKFAVHQPDLIMPLAALEESNADSIRNILAFYRDLDDDAAIALAAFEHYGLPKHVGGDFKSRWGLDVLYAMNARKDINIWPSSVKPSSSEVQEVFTHLVNGTAIGKAVPTENWYPIRIPTGFMLMTDLVQTQGQVGLGELCFDLVTCERDCKTLVAAGAGKNTISVGRDIVTKLAPDWRKKAATIAPGVTIETGFEEGRLSTIHISKDLRMPRNIRTTRQLLTSGVFPLWRAKDASVDELKRWQQAVPKKQVFVGKTLYPAVTPKET